MTDEAAYLAYLKEQEKYKVYMLPGSICLLFLLPLLFFSAESRLLVLFSLLAFPQTISYIFLTVMVTLFPEMSNSIIPSYVIYALGGLFILLNIIHFCFSQYILRKDLLF